VYGACDDIKLTPLKQPKILR